MKLKHLTLLALTACTLIVIGTGVAKAIFLPESSQTAIATAPLLVQSTMEESELSSEVKAINQTTLEHLQADRENLSQTPSIRRTVVNEDYAIATWIWGEAGGQSVLSLTEEGWQVLASGGGAVDVSVLEAAGVPTTVAEQLVESDQASW